MIGKTVLHYRIEDKLGQGGMGEVYRARDTRLGREVALKFLPPSLRDDREARMRLLREAQAASKLVHANIVAIHAIEQEDEHDFIVMEYVSGRPLDRVIADGKLTMARALELARQVADGLAVAHAAGVVHRDIKASNIIVSDRGDAKILDFGLATFHGATQVTEAGSTLGTVAYMSPEQTEGAAADARSDIFSFGVVLYEMVAGRRPFSGETRTAIAQAILSATPEPLARYKADVPDLLQRIVDKALRKKPAERYQSAQDMLADLRALQRESDTGPVPTSESTTSASVLGTLIPPGRPIARIALGVVAAAVVIVLALRFLGRTTGPTPTGGPDGDGRVMLAVLPFENLGAAEDEYFADGITEEITARLAGVDGLGVIARTSVLQYKGSTSTVQEVGAELGVDYVLEGTVRWQRGSQGTSRVRVTPQLVRVSDATHIWAEVYDQPMTEVFQVQSAIAQGVVGELGIALLAPDRDEITEAPTANVEAYDYYLRGKNKQNESGGYDEASLAIAQRMYERAVELDPGFIAAYAELSRVHSDMYWFHNDRSEERVLESKRVAERALELDPESPDALLAIGWYYYHGRSDYEPALDAFHRALEKRPNDATILAATAFVQRRQGRFDEALETLQKASRFDPHSSELAFSVAETLGIVGRYDEARKAFEETLRRFPGHEVARNSLARLLVYHYGEIAPARELLLDGQRLLASNRFAFDLWDVELCARDYGAAIQYLQTVGEDALENQFLFRPANLCYALTYNVMGRDDDAREQFAKARDELVRLTNALPEDPRYHGALGIAYAGLGMADDAVREGERARGLQPLSADAMKAPFRHLDLAQIFVLLDRRDLAVTELDRMLATPSELKAGMLEIHPFWDPIHDHPRFADLVKTP